MAKRQKDERRPIVLDLYVNQKLSAVAIERQTGISTTAVYQILYAEGISPKDLRDSGERTGKQGGSHRFSADMERRIVDEYKSGASYNSLAAKYDGTAPLIRRILKRHGETPRGRGAVVRAIAPELAEQIITDWHSGMSQTALGRKYHVHQRTMCNILRRFHIEPEQRHLCGEDHGMWKTGKINMGDYICVWLSPKHDFFHAMARGSGYVFEHRLVMAEALGRPLHETETVHHLNGRRDDNRLENLQLRQGQHGAGVIYHCADCGSFNVVAQAIADAPAS